MPPNRQVVFQTKRLFIRQAMVIDAALFYQLWTNPQVMRHVGFPHGLTISRQEIQNQFTHTNSTAVEATPNVNNPASIKMQEADGGICIGEDIHEFPESMADFTEPVHHLIYRVSRKDWQRQEMDQGQHIRKG